MSSVNPSLSYLVNNASPSTLPPTEQTAQQYKTEFLTLLLTQLKNQDPTNPVDSTQMVAQQAQIASLEQMQNLNTNFIALMAMQNVSQATSLIGKTVVAKDTQGLPANGMVTGIRFENGQNILKVDTGGGNIVDVVLSAVTEVNL
jgi:flagellar basal-body rod modification protein FlgD